MKLSLQNKIVLPAVATLLIVMIGGSFFLSKLIADIMKEDTLSHINAGNIVLAKNIKNSAENYKACVSAITGTVRVQEFSQAIIGEGGYTVENTLPLVQRTLERFLSTYKQFAQFNLCDANGKVLVSSSQTGKVALGYNVAQEEYFRRAMQGQVFISAPHVNDSIGEKAVTISAPVKVPSGKTAGVFYCVLTCKQISEDTVLGFRIGDTGYSFIVDYNTGLVVAHTDESRIVTQNLYSSQPWMRNAVQGHGETKADYVDFLGKAKLCAYFIERTSGWIAVSLIEESELLDAVAHVRNITIGMMVGAALMVCAVLIIIVRGIIRDLQATNTFAQTVAGGDLEKTLDVRRTDELGNLGDALRTMVESLKEMIKQSKIESENAKREADNAQKSMAEAEVSAKKAQEAQDNILNVAKRLEEMGSIISSASTQLAAQIEQSDKGAADSAARLSEAASAMNQMNATVQEVARNASSAANASAETRAKALAGGAVVSKSVNSIEEMRTATLALRDDMSELNDHAQSISHIMGVISDIADQTNLLALNAAIEAARAGEAGRGFAVVADEVRKLAEKTMASTADVGKVTTAIQTSTSKSMEGMAKAIERLEEVTQYARESGSALQEIVANVEATTDQVNAIATAAEEQSAASEEITRSIAEVNTLSSQTAQAMNEATQAIEQLAEQTQQMNNLMKEMQQ
ncbi:MAG: HAMP domain-containing protein [Desulfovibrionaceae bacterium]|nr:HAMP domain-containing protein [Desulfovibrionaceae bacterium]